MYAPAKPPLPALRVEAWLDYAPEVCELPGIRLDDVEVTGGGPEAVDRLWELGVRRVRLPRPVDLGAADPTAAAQAVQALCLVRDLTARAILTDWELRTGPDPDAWLPLNHYQPPAAVHGLADPVAADVLGRWRAEHYLCKCLWRQGPGFIQVRDRRWGELRRFTVPEPEYQQAIRQLTDGVPAAEVPDQVLADFRAERLVGEVGGLVWWLPYRVRRWLQEGLVI